jgi:hypothetical protein
MEDTYQMLHITLPPNDEQLAYLKHVEDTVKNNTQKCISLVLLYKNDILHHTLTANSSSCHS